MSTPGMSAFDQVITLLRPLKPSYCDYIADRLKCALKITDDEMLLKSVGRVQWDLHPEGGYMLSTKKTIDVIDRNDVQYRITVERCDEIASTPSEGAQ